MKKLLQSKRRGSAIPLAVVAVLILLAMGVGLLDMGLNSRIFATRSTSGIKARCAADAGLTMALFAMNKKIQDGLWNGSTLPQAIDTVLPYSDAIYSYTVTGDLATDYSVLSIGKSAQAQRTVSATLELRGIFEYAILTKEKLILKPDTLVDGYNSLDPFDTDVDVDLSTQSTEDASVILNTGVTVEGDISVGVGGDTETAIKDMGATTGDQFAGLIEDPLPLIYPPALPKMGTNITATAETVTITPAESGQYNNIFVKKGDTLGAVEISGNVVLYITGDIEIGESCELIIKDNSSLTLYIDGDIHCRANSGINAEYPPEDPKTFQIYGTSETQQSFDIKAKNDWSGTIYAPNADVILYANGDFYGSTVSNNFELKAGGNYHYDEALRKVSIEDAGVRFVVKRWYEGNPKSINGM
ncbi:MAG: hypothetical protein FVQ84_05060 [Planctomycetes bacterium]|nr:hypothetical protein [Planctomycetota bacterium]